MVTYLDNFETTILIFDNLFDDKYDGLDGGGWLMSSRVESDHVRFWDGAEGIYQGLFR